MISSNALQVYSKVSSETPLEVPTIDVSSKEFYGVGYDDSDKRIPDMTIINKQLGITSFLSILLSSLLVLIVEQMKWQKANGTYITGWNPKTSLWDLLESTLTYQHRTYSEAVKKATSKPASTS